MHNRLKQIPTGRTLLGRLPLPLQKSKKLDTIAVQRMSTAELGILAANIDKLHEAGYSQRSYAE